MIRKLCLAFICLLTICAASDANVIIDNFAVGAQIGMPSLNINRTGMLPGFTSDAVLAQSFGGLNPTFNAMTNTYDAVDYQPSMNVVNPEPAMIVTYQNFNMNVNETLGGASGMGPFVSLIVPVQSLSGGPWQLRVGGLIGGMGNIFLENTTIAGAGNQVVDVTGLGLENATTLTLRFTYLGQDSGSLSFGSGPLEAGVAAVPEPTTVVMFGTLVGFGLTHRRRRRK